MYVFTKKAVEEHIANLDAYLADKPELQAIMGGMHESILMADGDFNNIIPLVVELNGVETAALGVLDQTMPGVLRILAVAPPAGYVVKELLLTNTDGKFHMMEPDQTVKDIFQPN